MTKVLLICDLDGTLVDSYPGIAEALRRACRRAGVEPRVPIDRSIVGPPLDDLLRAVVGGDGDATLGLRAAFIEEYDAGACRLAEPFAGVEEMLRETVARGDTLALATNKRLKPARDILETLGWHGLFANVETVDSRPPGNRSKSRMLGDIVADVPSCRGVYIGDTADDVRAAAAAGLPCIIAQWGYGRHFEWPGVRFVATPAAVFGAIDS